MGLRDIAAADNRTILNDSVSGFGYSITITDPTGNETPFTGFSNDIGQLIDPDTGVAVSGRLATVAIHIQDILDAGLTLPESIADRSQKPWLVTFSDINGFSQIFKVSNSNPDRTLGMLVCILEFYKPAAGV